MLREVDEETGSLKLGAFTGALAQGKVYSGGTYRELGESIFNGFRCCQCSFIIPGSSDAFCKYSGAKGKVSFS